MSQKLQKGEVITVLSSKNIGQLLDNIKRVYPEALDEVHMIGIINVGIWGIANCDSALTLSKGDQVQFF
jgi:hypothetical protein